MFRATPALDGKGYGTLKTRLLLTDFEGKTAMARRCELTGKGVQAGHHVSHANNKKKRVFRPNLQHITLASDALGQAVSLRISMNALKTVDRNGGLDAFLLKANDDLLSTRALRLKRQIVRKIRKSAA